MATLFDDYKTSYGDEVQRSVEFSGLKHDFFLVAKADYLRRLVDERGLRAGGRRVAALDVGCGIGALHPYLDGIFDTLSGCDISQESIDRARAERPQIEYRHYLPNRLPFGDASFDIAFASCVLHHVPPEHWQEFIAEMKRVVRPGGVVAIIEHNPLNPLTRLAVLRCPFDEDAVLLSSRRTRKLLEGAGLHEQKDEHILLLPSDKPLPRRIERMFSRLPIGAQYVSSARV